jgi:hypothetical protein
LEPVGARVWRLSGEGQQCGYRLVAAALGGWTVKQVHALIVHTLDSIDDPPTLCRYGIMEDPNAHPDAVQRVKERLKSSTRYKEMKNLGDVEFNLVSHAMDGDLSFLFLSPGVDGFVRRGGLVPSAQTQCCVDPYEHAGGLATRKEVAAHWCSYTGLKPSESGAALPNHYDTIYNVMADGTDRVSWALATPETRAQYNRRVAVLLKAAADSTEDKRRQHAVESHAKPAAAPKKLRPVTLASAVGAGQHGRTGVTRRQVHRQVQPAKTITVAGGRGSQSLTAPLTRRPRVWRVIPRPCEIQYLATVEPLFEAYHQHHCDPSGGPGERDALMEAILDLPQRALRRPGGRSGSVRTLQQVLAGVLRKKKMTAAAAAGSAAGDRPVAEAAESVSVPCTGQLQAGGLHCEAQEQQQQGEQSVAAATAAAVAASTVPSESEIAAAAAVAAQPHSDSETQRDSNPTDGHKGVVRRAVGIAQEAAPRSLSRAVNALLQPPSVPLTAAIVEQLRELHPAPARTEPLADIPAGQALMTVTVDQDLLMQLLKTRVDNGSSPGPSGWTGSHLQLLARRGSKDAKAGLCMAVQDICNGRFSGPLRDRLLACTLTPLWKNGVGSGIRPIAMSEALYKLAAHYCMSPVEAHFPALFPRIQFGVKRAGGAEAAAQLIRVTLEEARKRDPSAIALATDFKNAFNLMSRASAWEKLLATPETEPIWRMFRWAYATPSPLLVFDRSGELHSAIQSAEGTRQGDPFSAFVFALRMQPLYEASIAAKPNTHAIAVQDDLTLVGPATEVFAAFDQLKQQSPEYNMQLQVAKCKVFAQQQQLDRADAVASGIRSGCEDRQLRLDTKMEALGVMHGNDDAVQEHALTAAESHALLFARLCHPDMPVQIGFQLLRLCAQPRLAFLARTTPPELFTAAAEKFDEMMAQCFARLSGIDERAKSALEPSVSRQAIDTRIALPIRMGGVGLRPVAPTRHAAYFSSLAAILPSVCSAFPDLDDSDSSVSTQLDTCRREMGSQMDLSDQERTVEEVHATVLGPSQKHNKHTERTEGRGAVDTNPSHPSASVRLQRHHAAASAAAAGNSSSQDNNRRKTAAAQIGQLLRMPMSEVWQLARAASSDTATADSFLRDIQLQHHLTARAELQLYESHLRSLPPFHQVTHTATALNKGASDWMTVLPTEPSFQLTNGAFQLALRHRLGLLPFDTLAGKHCTNPCCLKEEAQRAHFISDPDHFHSCAAHRRTHLTVRHNNLVQVLMRLARSVGFYASHEPNQHQRPAAKQAEEGKEAATGTQEDDGWNEHADILLIKHGRMVYVDVAVTRPTTRTRLRHELRGVLTTPLFACKKTAERKHDMYDEIAALNGYEMVPFVLESYGGLAPEARSLLRTLASHATDMSERQWMMYAKRCISVALQAGNAFIAQAGMQQQCTSQVRRTRFQDSQRRYEASRATTRTRAAPSVSAAVAAAAAKRSCRARALHHIHSTAAMSIQHLTAHPASPARIAQPALLAPPSFT